MGRLGTLPKTFHKFATNNIEESDKPAVADSDNGFDESTKIAPLLLEEEIDTPLRQLEDYLDEMPGILDVFDIEKSPDHTSFRNGHDEFQMQALRRLPPSLDVSRRSIAIVHFILRAVSCEPEVSVTE
mgnify:CR=1 FL=1